MKQSLISRDSLFLQNRKSKLIVQWGPQTSLQNWKQRKVANGLSNQYIRTAFGCLCLCGFMLSWALNATNFAITLFKHICNRDKRILHNFLCRIARTGAIFILLVGNLFDDYNMVLCGFLARSRALKAINYSNVHPEQGLTLNGHSFVAHFTSVIWHLWRGLDWLRLIFVMLSCHIPLLFWPGFFH